MYYKIITLGRKELESVLNSDKVSKTEFSFREISIELTANNRTEITEMAGAGKGWIPVVTGHTTTIKAEVSIHADGSKWYIWADVSQTYKIHFFKYPSFN